LWCVLNFRCINFNLTLILTFNNNNQLYYYSFCENNENAPRILLLHEFVEIFHRFFQALMTFASNQKYANLFFDVVFRWFVINIRSVGGIYICLPLCNAYLIPPIISSPHYYYFYYYYERSLHKKRCINIAFCVFMYYYYSLHTLINVCL